MEVEKVILIKDKLLIGEFSKKTGISKRMLRHYDELGLLKPEHISDENNYRYYHQNQMSQVNIINILKSFGFHLHEIKKILDNSVDMPSFLGMLSEKEAEIRIKIDIDIYNLAQIEKFISTFKKSENQVLTVLEGQEKERRTGDKMKEIIVENPINLLQEMDDFYARQKKLIEKHNNEPYFYYVTFDIDRFLMVNETCGFEVGDQVIAKTFELIKNNISKFQSLETGIYARTGGDEISLFMTAVTKNEIIGTIKQCIDDVSQFDFSKIGCHVDITISAGIAKLKSDSNIRAFRHESIKALMSSKHRERASYQLIEN
ncbi:MAG: MerR family transcriptional regulator [Clostridia bacterium]|nr:MerR family transcriptional regulator [Clostridia bacterium]